MKKFFVVQSGLVVDTIIVPDSATTQDSEWQRAGCSISASDVGAEHPVRIPVSVTPRQLRQWLIENALLGSVEAVINGIPDETQKALVRNFWEYSTEFYRAHPVVSLIGGSLGMSSSQIDAAFLACSVYQ